MKVYNPDKNLWYFAYGTNMSSKVLARRGLLAIESQRGILNDYRFRFSHAGLIPIEQAFANIEPKQGGLVYGVLHRFTDSQMERLDRYEGAEYKNIEIIIMTDNGTKVPARAYLDPNIVPNIFPSRRYLNCCITGAREFGLPEGYIQSLESHKSVHWPFISNCANYLVRFAETLRFRGLRPEKIRMAKKGRHDEHS